MSWWTPSPRAGPASSPRSPRRDPRASPTCSCAGLSFQAHDQLVQPKLLQRVSHHRELVRAQLDQRLALADELQRLVEARLARVQAPDDLLDPCGGRLVGQPLDPIGLDRLALGRALAPVAHRSTIRAGSTPSANLSRSSRAARARSAVRIGSPSGEWTRA